MPRGRIYRVANCRQQFALCREGSRRTLITRDEAVRFAQCEPDRAKWYRAEMICVVLPDGQRADLRVPVLRKLATGELAPKTRPVRIKIGKFIQAGSSRVHGRGPLGGRGRRVVGGDWRRPNSSDEIVDSMIAGDLNFEVIWKQRLPVRSEEEVEEEIRKRKLKRT